MINFAENIEITAKNERALAQAFYCLEDKMNMRKALFSVLGGVLIAGAIIGTCTILGFGAFEMAVA